MSPDRWVLIEAIFSRASDLDAEERDSYLDGACVNAEGEPDARLRLEVGQLLAADPGAESFLGQVNSEVVEPLLDPLIGSDAGHWRIVRRIGRGGMADVYLGERVDGQFEQRVALKVLRDVRSEVVRRFQAERSVLASIDHPGIARLIDGGVLTDGRPYFAMEFVDGVPLTTFADRHSLSVADRLIMFSEICEVVRYAHSRLVVHRDIKPSNVLVASDGGTRRVKLLDFGIAKVLGDDLDGSLTEIGGIAPMTPEYASPEQIRGDDITTATDVYALGVLLYELLTGHRPYQIPSRVRHAVERAILEEEPTAPSAAASLPAPLHATSGADAPTAVDVATARSSVPDQLRRRLQGDLDQIVLKALRKDPTHRYSSAESLARDIGRHLEGLPVEARPPKRLYRLNRFIKRNAKSVVSAAAICLVSLVAAATYTVRVTQERDRAETQAARAESVTADLIKVFQAVTPEQARGDTLTALALLEAGAARIEARLGENPAADAPLALALARTYVSLGAYETAATWAARAAGLFDDIDDPSTAAGIMGALLVEAQASSYGGGGDRALVLYLRAVVHARASGEDSLLVQGLSSLGEQLARTDDSVATEKVLTEALRVGRASRSVRPLLLLTPIQELALLRHSEGRQDEAVALYREALGVARRGHARPHPDVAYALLQLARILPVGEAEPLAAEAVRVATEVPRGTEPIAGRMLGFHAGVISRLGRHAEALELSRRSLDADVRDYGPDHPIVAHNWMSLASLAGSAGAFEEAVRAAQRGTALHVEQREATDPVRLSAESTLAELLGRAGRSAEAEALARGLIRRFSAASRADETQLVRAVLADALVRQGRLDEARRILRTLVSSPPPFAAKRVFEAAAALNDAAGNRGEAHRYRSLAEQ